MRIGVFVEMRHQGNMNLLTGQRERDQKKSPKKMPYPQQILRNCQVGANSVKYYALDAVSGRTGPF